MRYYPFEPLGRLAESKGWNATDIAMRVGVKPTTVRKWKERGRLSESTADRVAIGVGLMPADLWPEWGIEDAEAVEAHLAVSRERRAATKRRYRAANPDYAERQRASRAAYYETAGDYERARQRRYYADNAEQERVRVRAYAERQRSKRAS